MGFQKRGIFRGEQARYQQKMDIYNMCTFMAPSLKHAQTSFDTHFSSELNGWILRKLKRVDSKVGNPSHIYRDHLPEDPGAKRRGRSLTTTSYTDASRQESQRMLAKPSLDMAAKTIPAQALPFQCSVHLQPSTSTSTSRLSVGRQLFFVGRGANCRKVI